MPDQVPKNGKMFSRRLWATVVWAILINLAFLKCVSLPTGLEWFAEYGKFMTFGLVFLVTGLTLTDVFVKK